MKNKEKWVTIEDSKVRHVWRCDDGECQDQGKEIDVAPTFYADSGTPMCECGLDMEYVRTEILK